MTARELAENVCEYFRLIKHYNRIQSLVEVAMTNAEVNEAVARKLGWVDSDFPVNGNGWIKLEVKPGSWTYLDEFPDYSTSIAKAWEVVEQPGLWVTVSRILNREFGLPDSTIYTTYHCEIFRNHSDNRAMGEADTAPMAICLAFLELP